MAPIAAPPAVAPTLEACTRLGVGCREPSADNVPSDLLQWSCRMTLGGVTLTAVLDGNDQGVFDFVAQVPADADPLAARAAFGELVAATPALGSVGAAVEAMLRAWDGRDAKRAVHMAMIGLERDQTWITLAITPAPRDEVTGP
jgi:hypothetical protein